MSANTSRIRLRPLTPEQLLALVEGDDSLEERFDLHLADGLRDFFQSDDVSPAWIEMLRSSPAADPWIHGFGVELIESGLTIGAAGFKGPPDPDGVVEISYGIVPGHQRRGYATDAAAALVAVAFDEERVCTVRAHTMPDSEASMGVLKNCGFERLADVVDPDDGLVTRWERTRKL